MKLWKFTAIAVFALTAAAAEPKPAKFKINGATQRALDRISATSMKAHVQFLASDALAGRATPSPGLEAAAEYIASQFLRMRLEPAGPNGYFQNVEMVSREFEERKIAITGGGKTWELTPRQASPVGFLPLTASGTPIVKLTGAALKDAKAEDLAGKALLIADIPQNQISTMMSLIGKAKPAVVLTADVAMRRMLGGASAVGRLSFPGEPAQRMLPAPFVTLNHKELAEALNALPTGATEYTVTARFAPVEQKITLRNVAGIVRGSDPVLKNEFIIVSAHYDHLASRPDLEGDGIYNGANDDASGTASVMELAHAFVQMEKKPKRSILFLTFFGEESGLLGARGYAKNPLVPLKQTIANVNLEHMGRTDANDGPKVNYGSFTGFDFSDMPGLFAVAGKAVGVSIVKDEKRSDAFFARSDNVALAQLGIPSHTICVAFEFPDYHQPGDHWDKIDYDNMARVNRAMAAGLILMANQPQRPQWNEKNDKTKRYVEAARKLQQQAAQPAAAPSAN